MDEKKGKGKKKTEGIREKNRVKAHISIKLSLIHR